MKKLISTILALSLIFTTMAFVSVTASANTSTTYDYGTMLYKEDFDSSSLNTTENNIPKWVIGSAGYTISDSSLDPAGDMNVNFMNPLLSPASGEKLVIEMKLKCANNAGQLFTVNMKDSTNTEKTVFGIQAYGANLILRNAGSTIIGNGKANSAWTVIKMIYDPIDGKWDTLADGKCTQKDITLAALTGASLNKIAFTLNPSVDYIKVYSTKNIVSLDFDEAKEDGDFYTSKITKTSGNVSLTTEDGYGCLLIEQTSAEAETTSLELSIPSVYANTNNPYVVVEGRFKNTGGANTNLLILGSNDNGAHQLTALRHYNNFLYVKGNGTSDGTHKVKENYDGNSWFFAQIIVNATNPTSVTFDVVVDGVLVQNDIPAVIASADNVNTLTFMKTSAGASKLFVDYVNVYNATEAVVSDILYQGKTAYAQGESAALTAVVKDNSGAEISGKGVTYTLKESYDGVAISDGTITVADSAETGFFTVVASTQANGVEYSEEIDMRVVSNENPYKVLSSSVTNAAVSFELADVSPSGADLWTAIAVYNSDTSLKKVIIRTPSFENHVWSDDVSLNGIAGQGDLVKVFFWNSLSQMKPYFAELNN